MESYGEGFGKGDVVSVQLDLIRDQIIFSKNDKTQGIAYDHVIKGKNVNYALAISMHTKATIEIFDYKCESMSYV